jgi:tRNA A-37 threonylcarbamoyl transferase component Bud32
MIAQFTETFQTWLPIALGVALLMAGVYVGIRRGQGEALANTEKAFAVAEAERALYAKRAERLEGELAEQRTRHEAQITEARGELKRLEGVVERQSAELDQLRALVMLETVPDALRKALGATADDIVDRLNGGIGIREEAG